jgi:hypothetical protein
MNTVTLEIASREKSNKRFLSAMTGKSEGAFISFEFDYSLQLFTGNNQI